MEYISLKYPSKLELKLCLSKMSREDILSNTYGMEREMLRVINGKNSPYDHPEVFGDRKYHPYITTDYAENQIELVTPTFDTIDEMVNFNTALYDICASELKEDEILWPFSMPCKIDDSITEAKFSDQSYTDYRMYLTSKYGKHKQMISGIHFNFSVGDGLLKKLYKQIGKGGSFFDFKNNVYLKIFNNYLYYRYLITLLTSASSTCDKSFGDINDVYAIRSSKHGYCNICDLGIDYSSIENFVKSVADAKSNNLIIDEREIYDSIRIKNGQVFVANNLKDTGIKYLEIRNIDINPLYKSGIRKEDLEFLELILLYCLYVDEIGDKSLNCKIANTDNPFKYKDIILSDLNSILDFVVEFKLGKEVIIQNYIDQVKNERTLSVVLKNKINSSSFIDNGIKLGEKYKQDAYLNRFKFFGYEFFELSTQLLIKESVKRGILVDILDKFDNFIALNNGSKIEYVKQATKTSKDSYISMLMMENKVVTKNILRKHAINVPRGKEFTNVDLAINSVKKLKGNFVIKPKSTNFGLGVNIFKDVIIFDDVEAAIHDAFSHDKTILIEEFISGNEYRFLVIGNKVSGVLHRVPANVVGDGIHSIKELVEIKNQDNLRGVGYVTPLEKIEIDETVIAFLSAQGIAIDDILPENKIVYLRENSNISTGGDSIDYTDEVHSFYNNVAIAAAKAVDASFCGVDLMISDITTPNSSHAIIELNFNPAIHIHSYPYIGKERNIAFDVLKELELI